MYIYIRINYESLTKLVKKVFVNQPWLLGWTTTTKLRVGGKPMVANEMPMPREYFSKISE